MSTSGKDTFHGTTPNKTTLSVLDTGALGLSCVATFTIMYLGNKLFPLKILRVSQNLKINPKIQFSILESTENYELRF